MFKLRWNRLGQITIFIIIAIILIAAVAGFFILRSRVSVAPMPASLEPVYNAFLTCVEEDTLVGVSVLESQGGYIYLPEFEKGSAYMPFSSQLDFLGNPVPYWYYVSENNIPKEQVPTVRDMEEQLEEYLESKVQGCLLDEYLESGYGVSMGDEVSADVEIRDEEVEVNLNMNLAIERANDSATARNHNVVVKTMLGTLYEDAKSIYDYEQDTMFLENYAVDTLRSYAPVDGVAMSCGPEIWNADEVFDELEQAIEANTLALKVRGGDFELQTKENRYFVVDIPGLKSDARFLNHRNWSHSLEVNPTDRNVMMAKPVGTQPGLGMLGFCYVPYHFVYNVNYPVMVQVYSGIEIFQFPFAVVIKGNRPREPMEGEAMAPPPIELCNYRNTEMRVEVYDTSLNPVDANISYECFGEICQIGETEAGVLVDLFPQCVNGFVNAEAQGFKREREGVESTAQEGLVIIIMDKSYKKTVNLKLDGGIYTGEAIINFVSNETSSTLIYPEQTEVELAQGEYEIEVYIYRNASIELEEQTQEQCLDVPQEGLGGLFGITDEECFDVTIPAQVISNALMGGGKQTKYVVESELQSGSIIDINAQSLSTPSNIEDLQKNYLEFEDKGLDIIFR
jgi:hypothetical protein